MSCTFSSREISSHIQLRPIAFSSNILQYNVNITAIILDCWHIARLLFVTFLEHIKIDERENQVNMIQRSGGHVRVRQPIKKKYLVYQEPIVGKKLWNI